MSWVTGFIVVNIAKYALLAIVFKIAPLFNNINRRWRKIGELILALGCFVLLLHQIRMSQIYPERLKRTFELWKFDTGGPIYSSVVQQDESIYVGSDDFHMYKIDKITGQKEWSFNATSKIKSTAVIGKNNSIFFSSENGMLFNLDCKTGNLVWNVSLGPMTPQDHLIIAPLTISADGTRVYVGDSNSSNCYYRCFDGTTGALIWQSKEFGGTLGGGTLSADGQMLIYGSSDMFIYATNATTGALIWRYKTVGSVVAAPTINEELNVVYVGCLTGELYILRQHDGKHMLMYTSQNASISKSVTRHGDVVYVPYSDGVVIFFQTSSISTGVNSTLGSVNYGDANPIRSPVVANSDGFYVHIGDFICYHNVPPNLWYDQKRLQSLLNKNCIGAYIPSSHDGNLFEFSDMKKSIVDKWRNEIVYIGSTDGSIRAFNFGSLQCFGFGQSWSLRAALDDKSCYCPAFRAFDVSQVGGPNACTLHSLSLEQINIVAIPRIKFQIVGILVWLVIIFHEIFYHMTGGFDPKFIVLSLMGVGAAMMDFLYLFSSGSVFGSATLMWSYFIVIALKFVWFLRELVECKRVVTLQSSFAPFWTLTCSERYFQPKSHGIPILPTVLEPENIPKGILLLVVWLVLLEWEVVWFLLVIIELLGYLILGYILFHSRLINARTCARLYGELVGQGVDAFSEIEDECSISPIYPHFNVKAFNRHQLIAMLFNATQLILQILNRSALGRWSTFGILSVSFTVFLVSNTLWRYAYFVMYKGGDASDLPVIGLREIKREEYTPYDSQRIVTAKYRWVYLTLVLRLSFAIYVLPYAAKWLYKNVDWRIREYEIVSTYGAAFLSIYFINHYILKGWSYVGRAYFLITVLSVIARIHLVMWFVFNFSWWNVLYIASLQFFVTAINGFLHEVLMLL